MKKCVFWFVTGSQHLYGEETLKEVSKHSKEMVEYLNKKEEIQYEIIWKPTVKTQGEITDLFKDASGDASCAGVITWMHTFSPSKMWINGLKQFKKPILHLHTQFNEEIPWDTMDMDLVDEVIKVSDQEAFEMSRELTRKEGIIAGTSSGAALAAVKKLVERVDKGNVVVIFPDRGDRYFSAKLYEYK